ncbi:hypothetical protein LDL76_13535 [Salegentibacter mishustinae]|uniref:HEPN domain-containing protein n=1 Tax=Salegentibacter mishustinae TaxID=270918 RepID=UPI001CE1F4C3|nr:HEPN domain-containing protein [Salegentibacter mishustinae]UBZ06377.1 hypothetical protein LDL76_13535 [Salegentibacter mishustinae]
MKIEKFNPFGMNSLEFSMNCKSCGRIINSHLVYIPTPGFNGPSRTTFSEWSTADCYECEHWYKFEVYTGPLGGEIHIEELENEDVIDIDTYPPMLDSMRPYEYETSNCFTIFKSIYNRTLFEINELNILRFEKLFDEYDFDRIDRYQKNLLFQGIITAMETYFSDVLYHLLEHNDEFLKRYIILEKINLRYEVREIEIVDRISFLKPKALDYLKSSSLHNVKTIKRIFKKVVEINFPEDLKEINKLVKIRHDIVHRNGKTKNGKSIICTKQSIEKAINEITCFVDKIDEQISLI